MIGLNGSKILCFQIGDPLLEETKETYLKWRQSKRQVNQAVRPQIFQPMPHLIGYATPNWF